MNGRREAVSILRCVHGRSHDCAEAGVLAGNTATWGIAKRDDYLRWLRSPDRSSSPEIRISGDGMRRVCIVAAVAAVLAGCQNDITDTSRPTPVDAGELARSVRISQSDTTLQSGTARQLSAQVLDASGGALIGLRLSWTSSDPRIATVDSSGLVSAVTPGAALVIAGYRQVADTVAITVLAPPVPPPPAPAVVLSVWPDTNVIFTGMTRKLSLSVARGSTTREEPAQSWTTSDPSVVTVENGIVTAVGAGHATIAANLESVVSPAIHVFVMPAPSPALRFTTARADCGLTTDGLLYCWNKPFPLMSGPFDRCREPGRFAQVYQCSEIPRLVSPDIRFKALGDRCAVTVDGALYCWGGNTNGELGLGVADDVTRGLTRVPVAGEFVEVASSLFTRCARRVDGVILCWGSNFRGDAGIGSSEVAASFVVPPTPINTTARFLKLGSGGNCGLATDSTAYCWGSHVGNVALAGCNTSCSSSPVQVKSEKLVDLDVSLSYCGIGVSGRAYCWGYHGFDPYSYPDPQEIPNPGFRSFENGLYAVDGSGAAFKVDTYAALWRFQPLDTGELRFRKYWGACGIARDDKLYCGSKMIPGQ